MGCEIDETGAQRTVTPGEQEQRIVRIAPYSENLGLPSSEKVENVALNSKAKLHDFEERSEGIVSAGVGEVGPCHNCPNSLATSSNNGGASGGSMEDRDPKELGAVGGIPPSGNNPCGNVRIEIEGETLKKLEELQGQLERCQDIPDILYEVPLSCLQERTIISLCYHLDVESEVMSPEGRLKDYRGMGEWIGLERVFIRYVIGASLQYKTKEIVSKWMTMEDVEADRKPIIRNLRQCLLDIDRPDVLEDMSVSISRDAVQWKRTNIEANLVQPKPVEDTSWQLTRHDVVSGKPAYYTCCLVYADEDERMAEVITKLYNRAYPESLFFRPQFDLKSGKYVYDTTAQVIEERCGGKAMFLISEYFLASDVCRFAVHFCKDMEGSDEQGNLIPFNLTCEDRYIPRVLRGITGVRWYRKTARRYLWPLLTDALLGGKVSQDRIEEVKERIEDVVDNEPEYFLADPSYDESTPRPGIPISVYDPPPEVENSDDPSSRVDSPEENDALMAGSVDSSEGIVYRRSTFKRFGHFIRKRFDRAFSRRGRNRQRFPSSHSRHFPV